MDSRFTTIILKKHIGSNGKPPAETSNIKVDGLNKWTIIQNAILHTCE